MSGYSQGAQLVHNAAALLEESNTAALDQVAAGQFRTHPLPPPGSFLFSFFFSLSISC